MALDDSERLKTCVCVYPGGGLNGSSVPAGVNPVAGSGLMMLNGGAAAVNPAASGLLMPGGAAAANTGVIMHRPFMLQSASSPAATSYFLAGGAGATASALVPQYVVSYPQQSGMSADLTAAYAPAGPYGVTMPPAGPYGVTMPPAALYGQLCFILVLFMC